MVGDRLINTIRQFEHLARYANDKSIREKCSELADKHRQMLQQSEQQGEKAGRFST
jgi:hypothetical protein